MEATMASDCSSTGGTDNRLTTKQRRAKKVDQICQDVHNHTPKIYEALLASQQLFIIEAEVEKIMEMKSRGGEWPVLEEAFLLPKKNSVAGGTTQAGKTVFPSVRMVSATVEQQAKLCCELTLSLPNSCVWCLLWSWRSCNWWSATTQTHRGASLRA